MPYVPWVPDKKAIKKFFDDLLEGRKATSPSTDATPLTGRKAINPTSVPVVARVNTSAARDIIRSVKRINRRPRKTTGSRKKVSKRATPKRTRVPKKKKIQKLEKKLKNHKF
jgi:hypothetical protein